MIDKSFYFYNYVIMIDVTKQIDSIKTVESKYEQLLSNKEDFSSDLMKRLEEVNVKDNLYTDVPEVWILVDMNMHFINSIVESIAMIYTNNNIEEARALSNSYRFREMINISDCERMVLAMFHWLTF